MTYRQKNIYLAVFMLLFGAVAYFFAIRRTLLLREEVNKMENFLKTAEEAPARINALQKQVRYFDTRLSSYLSTSERNQERVLDIISRFCASHHLTLKDFPPATVSTQNNFELETIEFTVQGEFVHLLTLVHYLEQEAKTGRMASVKFFSEMNYRTMKKMVFATVFLQYIKKKDEN